MVEMRRVDVSEWQVIQDGVVVFSGDMLSARVEYARRMSAQLNAKPQTRKHGKRIYS